MRNPHPGRPRLPVVKSRATAAATSGKIACRYITASPSADASSMRRTSTSSATATVVLTAIRRAVVTRKMTISRAASGCGRPCRAGIVWVEVDVMSVVLP